MGRRFHHLGKEWEASPTGIGVGVATGYIPRASHWGVLFSLVSDKSSEPLRGDIRESDPANLPEDDLKRELERQLILRAIRDSEFLWRTPGGISSETGIDEASVVRLLEGMADEVIRSVRSDKSGRPLYTTRDRYKRDTGIIRRYFDTINLPTGSGGEQ